MKKMVMILAGVVAGAGWGAQPGFDTFISHRGESIDAPENTMPAFRTAVERGFGFECDVYLSKDGRVFTFHDGDLRRTSGGTHTNRCAAADWEGTISKLDVGGWGKWKGSKFAGTRPALLEEVLELARDGRWIYVELKTGPEIVPYVKRILEGQKKAHAGNVLFITFSRSTCRKVKEELPGYKAFWLTGARVGRGKDAKPVTAEYLLKALEETKADGVDCHFDKRFVTEELVGAVRGAGKEFHVWTVNRLEDSLEAFRRGAQTVTTDCAKKQLDQFERRIK